MIADGENNILRNNGGHGVQISTSANATFGDATVGLPPGRHVILNGTTASNNGLDGFNISAVDNSQVLLEITSNRTAPEPVGAHDGLNNNGDTNINGNGDDGVSITTTGGTSDIVITSGTGATTISGNGGHGIRWDSSGDSDGTVTATRTNISSNNDGVLYNVSGRATATLVVGGVGAGNVIQNNRDDGIDITATFSPAEDTNLNGILDPGEDLNGDGFLDDGTVSRPILTIQENIIGGEANGTAAGNGGDGISMNIVGGTAMGIAPANVDATGIFFPDFRNYSDPSGAQADGPIVQMTVTDNVITNNGARGVNLLIQGAAGERNRENGFSVVDPVNITLTGNEINSNGAEGVFFRGDADMHQQRFVYFENPSAFDANGNRVLIFNNTNFSPGRSEFTNLNIGTVNGTAAYLNPYQNLRNRSEHVPDGDG